MMGSRYAPRVDPKWMRGQLWDMAIALQEATELPLYGLFDDEGVCHHAFVWDADLGLGIDARGAKQLPDLVHHCRGSEMRPITRDEIEKVGGFLGRPLDAKEIREANGCVRKHLVLHAYHVLRDNFDDDRAGKEAPAADEGYGDGNCY